MATVKKILIVDDDGDDREMFGEALAEVAPDSICYSAPNARKALSELENRNIDIPDLIFLDINMPQMNGWQTLCQLKEAEPHKNIPVIMYSTSTYPEDVEKAGRLGALCFFSKPSEFKLLKKSISLVIAHLNANSLQALADASPLFLKAGKRKDGTGSEAML